MDDVNQMAELIRAKIRWNGFAGAPGYTNFHFQQGDGSSRPPDMAVDTMAKVQQFTNDIRTLLPYQVTIKMPTELEIVDSANGQLIDVITAPTLPDTIGTATASDNYAAAVGAVISFRTNGIRNGRRVRGRTFIVPATSTAFENNGTLRATAIAACQAGATTLMSSTNGPTFGIFARPTGPSATDGLWFPAVSASVPDMGAVLRSRRD